MNVNYCSQFSKRNVMLSALHLKNVRLNCRIIAEKFRNLTGTILDRFNLYKVLSRDVWRSNSLCLSLIQSWFTIHVPAMDFSRDLFVARVKSKQRTCWSCGWERMFRCSVLSPFLSLSAVCESKWHYDQQEAIVDQTKSTDGQGLTCRSKSCHQYGRIKLAEIKSWTWRKGTQGETSVATSAARSPASQHLRFKDKTHVSFAPNIHFFNFWSNLYKVGRISAIIPCLCLLSRKFCKLYTEHNCTNLSVWLKMKAFICQLEQREESGK